MFETPVLLIVFNRPDVTFRVFEKIRQLQPKYLFIAADGPRADKPGEAELCEQTRAVFTRIDWDCELKTLYHGENRGCGKGVSEAITWFFDQVEAGIILEDDCLPDPTFFTYCTELLDYYKNDERVMHVGGTNSQFGKSRNNYSYYFSKYPHIWGWASWRRAWNKFQYDLSKADTANVSRKIFQQYRFSEEEKKYWTHCFDIMKKGALDTWDIQWTYSCWANGGVTVVPNINLISNIGFDTNATHTKSSESRLANLPVKSMTKIIHPKEIAIDVKADEATFNSYNLSRPSAYHRVRTLAASMLPKYLKEKIKSHIR